MAYGTCTMNLWISMLLLILHRTIKTRTGSIHSSSSSSSSSNLRLLQGVMISCFFLVRPTYDVYKHIISMLIRFVVRLYTHFRLNYMISLILSNKALH